jgi:hypothetical protein
VESRGLDELQSSAVPRRFESAQDWKLTAITGEILLLTRSAVEITSAQRLKVQEILNTELTQAAEMDKMGLEDFRPETD